MKKFIGIIIWTLVVAGVIFALLALRAGYKQTLCTGIDVRLDDAYGSELITENDIITRIQQADDSLVGKKLTEVNLLRIDQSIEKAAFVKEADVFTTFNGVLKARIHSWDPVARVLSGNENYYIDRSGVLIPSRQGHPVRTLVITGEVNLPYSDTINLKNVSGNAKNISILQQLFPMILHLNEDNFFHAQIEQIFINKHGEIELIPKVGNHVIMLGTVDNFEKKLNKLFVFYKQGLKQSGWNKYKTINLKYEDQVVCSKH